MDPYPSSAGFPFEAPKDRTVPICLLGMGIYFLLHVLLAPADPLNSNGFTHDSAYLWIIANNLIEGRGFVNDAHWLVFLTPDTLPVPYHNGNPLFPSLIAAVVGVTGWSVTEVAFSLNAVANTALIFAVGWLVRAFAVRWSHALALGFLVAVFSPVFSISFHFGTDAWSLLLLVLFLGALVRDSAVAVLLGGLTLGVAWLVRSDAVLVLPATGIFLWMHHGFKAATVRVIATLGLAAVVASPWLWWTWSVWGSPLRSDSAYYLLQDWHAREMGGIDVMQYWHSTSEPEGLGSVVSADPVGFLHWTVAGAERVVRAVLARWASYQVWVGCVFLVGGLWGIKRLLRERPRETVAMGILGFTYVLIFSIRSYSVEPRYLSLPAVLFAVVVGVGFFDLLRRAFAAQRSRGFAWVGLAIVAAAFIVPALMSVSWRRDTNESLVTYRAVADNVAADIGGVGPVVVGDAPYFFTQTTGVPALSMPFDDERFLRAYMERYGATHVALTERELAYWRPEWREATPEGFAEVRTSGDYRLFRRIPLE